MTNMTSDEWQELDPRARAVWPAGGKSYTGAQYALDIRLDRELVDWFMEYIVGNTADFSDMEETIAAALYNLREEMERAGDEKRHGA